MAVAREVQADAKIDAFRQAEGLGEEPIPLVTAEAESCLAAAQSRASALGQRKVPRLIRVGKPAETLLSVAAEIGADTIVLGRHNHSELRRSVVGSVSRKIVAKTQLNLLQVW